MPLEVFLEFFSLTPKRLETPALTLPGLDDKNT
jgi:hypothetical protein